MALIHLIQFPWLQTGLTQEATPPSIVRQTGSLETKAGNSFQLFIEAAGSEPLRYQWLFNGLAIPGANKPNNLILNLSETQVGIYTVEVSNALGDATSNPMKITINPADKGSLQGTWDARFESQSGSRSNPCDTFILQDGGAMVAAEFVSEETSNHDMMVVKYDDAGIQEWARRVSFNDHSQEDPIKALLDKHDNVIVGGTTRLRMEDLMDAPQAHPSKDPVHVPFLASVGKDANVRWTFSPDIALDEQLNFVDFQGNHGDNLYILNNVVSEQYTGMEIQILDMDSGLSSFTIRDKTDSNFTALDMAIMPSSDIVILGRAAKTDRIQSGVQVRKYSIDGQLQWTTDLGAIGLLDYEPTSLHKGLDETLYLLGTVKDPSTGIDIQILRLNTEGEKSWVQTLVMPHMANDIPKMAKVDTSGNLILVGETQLAATTPQSLLAKCTPTGAVSWSLQIPNNTSNQSDTVSSMDLDSLGNIYLSATRFSPSSKEDFAVLKFSPSGEHIFETRSLQEGPVSEQATHIDADDDGNVVLSGFSLFKNAPQMVTLGMAAVLPVKNQLPDLNWNTQTLQTPLLAPGQWTFELEASDPDGEISLVEFLQGSEVIATDQIAPYTMVFASKAAMTGHFFARVYDNLGGVTISEGLPFNVLLAPTGSPQTSQDLNDIYLPKGSQLTLDYGISGAEPIFYQWFLNGERLKGENKETLTLVPGLNEFNSGNYQLRAKNSEGHLWTNPVVVSMDLPLLEGADQFDDATPIAGGLGIIRASNREATEENGEPRHGKKRGGKSIWYRWRPDSSGLATFSLRGSSFDTLLSVYAGNDLTQLTEIEYDDDRGGFSTSKLEFNAIGGVDYLIAIDGFNGSSGNILLSWRLDTAIAITLPSIRITPQKMTMNLGAPYTMTTSITGNLTGVSLQWFHNGAAIPGATEAEYSISSAEAETAGAYWISITAGDLTTRSRVATCTVNVPRLGKIIRELVLEEKFADLFNAIQENNPVPLFKPMSPDLPFAPRAVSLVTGFTGAQIFNTFGATKEVNEPDHCGVPGGASQWFAYQAPADGNLSISTDGSDFNTVIAAYTSSNSSFESLNEIACDNDGGMDGLDSRVNFPVTQGGIYYIAVDGVNAVTGTVHLAYDLEVGLSVETVSLQDQGMQLTIQAAPNIPFVIQSTDDFTSWHVVANAQTTDSTFIFVDNEALTGSHRFYRVYLAE
jgi:hypothetical protein